MSAGAVVPPLLTVVTTTYRDPAGLRATLESALAVGLPATEIIVVDGEPAASSQAGEIVGRLNLTEHGYAVTVCHGPDAGPYHAMNKGILAGRGTWVWFMNSGDRFAADSAAFVRWCADEPAEWAVGRWLVDGEERLHHWEFSREGVIRGDIPNHQAVLFRREAFAAVGLYDLRYAISADYDLMLALAERAAPAAFGGCVCVYEGGGLSDRHRTRLRIEQQRSKQRRRGITPLTARDWLQVGWRWARDRRGP